MARKIRTPHILYLTGVPDTAPYCIIVHQIEKYPMQVQVQIQDHYSGQKSAYVVKYGSFSR